ncbi:potassium channel family protein [Vibrio sp. SS-MA-C1-2]|uniref:potassium channel family protein n=1 Tax=Vibrio sp. SS-MA-C1-2 TaxID=2908646 RepID=UPI001F32577F|nr:potassium channel family protein [Vibrio sp. SS-MA-C1-2]UJF19108.1 potassium channel family protein [Vibrio sp. SS-MA-C1-2]
MKKVNIIQLGLRPLNILVFILSIVSIGIVISLLFIPRDNPSYRLLLFFDTIICAIFWLQLIVDFIRSDDKKHFLQTHWIDFLASIPVIEAFRFARVFQILRIYKLIKASKGIWVHLAKFKRETTLAGILLLLTILLTLGSSFVLFAEHNTDGANITTAGDALWWAFVTVSTVGYGDYYPVSALGRIFSVIIIIAGVGIFGMVSGLITSYLSESNHEREEALKKLISQQQQMLKQQQQMVERQNRLLSKLEEHNQNNQSHNGQ